ncbi:MAG: tetratricopeptide repeat protein [Candidatus Limnocylindria bacterium]
MPEPILLDILLALVGAVVLLPLRAPARSAADDDLDAFELRHRIALEALRDVEADRRGGALDEASHAEQREAAEQRAALTLAELEAARAAGPVARETRSSGARRGTALVAGAIGAALLAGTVIPAAGLVNPTVVDEQRAAEEAAEAARQYRIATLLDQVADDPSDAGALSALADEYLAGDSADELARAAAALQLVIALEPDNADAYRRIVTAYLRAGDYTNARAALGAFSQTESADPADLAFFEGIIALRGDDDPAGAVEAFDEFLELAPDDPRVPMVESLRDEADAAR